MIHIFGRRPATKGDPVLVWRSMLRCVHQRMAIIVHAILPKIGLKGRLMQWRGNQARNLSIIVAGLCIIGTVFLLKGFGISNRWIFGGRVSTKTMAGPSITVFIDTHMRSFSLLGARIYTWSRPPGALQIDMFADRDSFRTINLRRANVEYADGERRALIASTNPLVLPFEPYYHVNLMKGYLVTNYFLTQIFRFEDAIDRMRDLNVECAGDFVSTDGIVIPFAITNAFVAEKDVGLRLGWQPFSP